MSIDLHCHSTFSDGTMTPKNILLFAKNIGLNAISITDHDCIDANIEASLIAKSIKIEYIPGIELSCKWNSGQLHALGYFIDINNKYLLKTLLECKKLRDQRNPKIINKLNSLNIKISIKDVISQTKSKIIGRVHIANCLVKKGYVKSIEEAFSKYIGESGSCFIAKEKISPIKAIRIIKKSNGIPVIAHPISLDKNINNIEKHLLYLKEIGFSGIEAIHPDHNKDFINYLIHFAKKNNMLITGGSDFHFFSDNSYNLGGINVPDSYLKKLKKYIKSN